MPLTSCVCNQQITANGIPLLRCSCGVLRQDVPMTPDEYRAWYEVKYFNGVYYHSQEQDRDVAKKRLDAYQLRPGLRLLDIGAGNGAFVDEAIWRGLDAWGQDLAHQSDGPRVYVGPLPEIGFPTAHFDVVTMHDVLEHVPEPRAMLREIRRILQPGGTLIVDFPRFHHEAGKHHWKEVEHLWMLDEDQLNALLASEGFSVECGTYPIPSKYVVTTTATPLPAPTRILVPPGIGDGYWVLTKLRGFCEARGIELPEVWVHDSGPRRSGDMWARVPFVRFGGYAAAPFDAVHRAYRTPDHPVQEKVGDFDFFLSLNGSLDRGLSLDEAMPDIPSRWREPIFRSKPERAKADEYRSRFGRYIVSAFWELGFYQGFLRGFPEDWIIQTLRIFADQGYTVVVMGADWDRNRIGSRVAAADRRFRDLIGETSFADLAALLEGAAGVFGFPAGNTMLGPYFGTPTALLWEHFPEAMWTNVVPPDAWYRALEVGRVNPDSAAAAMLSLIEGSSR